MTATMGWFRTLILAVCAVMALAVPVATGWGATPARKHPIVVRMQKQSTQLAHELTRQRAILVQHRQRFDAAAATHARLTVAVRQAHERLTEEHQLLPGSIVEDIYGTNGITSTLMQPIEAEETAQEHELDAVTERAARVQGEVLDTDRRIEAFETALEGARLHPERLNADPTYGFGGPGAAPVTAKSIDEYLESKASPLTGSGADFIQSGVKYRVDPRLIVAISGAESAFGLVTCAPHNGWGWGCPSSPFSFPSWAAAIDTVTKGIRENYISEGRTTVGEIHLKYAPPAAANDPTGLNYAWPNNVARFLIEQGGNPQFLVGSGPGGRARVGVSS